VSVSAKKRKRERERRAGTGWLAGPAGLAGPKGEQGTVFFLFFLTFFFQTTFLLKFKSKLLQTFSQKFINFLETTQATKTHASQLMMHNHLLSLSLLNYV
jgi:hypothetical protein